MTRNRRKPSKRKGMRGKHDRGVDELVKRLESKGYDTIETYVEFEVRRVVINSDGEEVEYVYRGERDVEATRVVHDIEYKHYYEHKSHYTLKQLMCAREQFQRTNYAEPEKRWKFIFTSAERVQRVVLDYGE